MPRPPRPLIPGGTYHLMNRGNRKMTIFEDERDRERFIQILDDTRTDYGVSVLGACLMGNHYHLIVVTPEGNVCDFMEQVQGRFAQFSNWRHRNVGHLFQGRYLSVVIENDLHLLTAACYVFLNPVVAGLTRRPEDWPWSTYAATIGLRSVPDYLTIDWIDTICPADSREISQQNFKLLLASGAPIQSYLLQCDRAADEQTIRRVVRSYTGRNIYQGPVPPLYRDALAPELTELIPLNSSTLERDQHVNRAHFEFGYRIAEIAQAVAMHPASVGRILRGRRIKKP